MSVNFRTILLWLFVIGICVLMLRVFDRFDSAAKRNKEAPTNQERTEMR